MTPEQIFKHEQTLASMWKDFNSWKRDAEVEKVLDSIEKTQSLLAAMRRRMEVDA